MPRTGRPRLGLDPFVSTSFSADRRLFETLERARAELYPEVSRSALITIAVRDWLTARGFKVPPDRARPAPPQRPRRPAPTPILDR